MADIWVAFLSLLSLVHYTLQANVLVTGGAGFIGYHLALHLQKQAGDDNAVIVLDNFNNDYDVKLKKARATKLSNSGVTVHEGDACDKPLLLHLLETHSINTIVHLASRTSFVVSINDPISLAHSNMECQMVILQVIKEHKNVRLVHVTSPDTVIDHASSVTPPPRNLLAAIKMALLDTSIKYCVEHSLDIIGVRPYSVYGPWDRPDNDVMRLATALYDGTSLEVYQTSSNDVFSRDYVYIDDVVNGIVAAISYTTTACDNVFDLGGGKLVTMETLVHLLERELDKKAEIQYKPLPIHEMDTFPADIAGTQKELNFNPQVTIEEGVKLFSSWFIKNQGGKVPYDEPSHSLRDKVEKNHVKERNKELFERLRKLKEKYANYLQSKGRPTAILYKEKKFIEKKGKYSNGGDGARTVSSRNVQEMKEVCQFVDECVGFSTDGKLKQYIAPESHWSSRPGMSLYLADINVCEAGMHNCYGNYTCTHLGPAQFKCGCVEGWGLIDVNHCVELYRKGHETEVEKEQKIGDKVIGRNWKEFAGNADFIPFKSRASPEGNLAYYPEAKGNVQLLKEACRNSYHCMGFNTNGLLKKIIRQPSKWKSSGGTLYVLDVDYCHMAISCPRGRRCRKLSPGKYDCA